MRARLKIWVILALTLVAVGVYAAIGGDEFEINGFKFRKIDLSSLMKGNTNADQQKTVGEQEQRNAVDTTRQRVLFFGDSMTSGLFYRLDDYCQANGHTLYSFTWYSATTQSFAESNLLDTYIKRYNPTFCIICLGSNELFVRDLGERQKYIAQILQKIGNRPYVWISPPNWKKDTGMDSLILKAVGSGRFFNSSRLSLQRSEDHIHPTIDASSVWMDSIAAWLGKQGATAHPIIMNKPQKKYHHAFTDYYQTSFKEFTGNDTPERHRHYFK